MDITCIENEIIDRDDFMQFLENAAERITEHAEAANNNDFITDLESYEIVNLCKHFKAIIEKSRY